MHDALRLLDACLPRAIAFRRQFAIFLLAFAPMWVAAQSHSQALVPARIPVVMFSDFHFDPFHDPAKIPLLAAAPVSEWSSILAMPDSPDQAGRFASLEETCTPKGAGDSPYTLLRSSLDAAKAQSPGARFVTLSGDLLVHDLDCKYRAAMKAPQQNADNQSFSAVFAEKTTAFVMQQVEAAFPRDPVYVALGNNDSRCNHNRMDLHDEYLKATAPTMLAGLRGVDATEKALARSTYESAGYYALTMPAPMINTRLIVVDDIYMMPRFNDCEATEDRRGEQEQIAWLQNQLDTARLKHQRVWVLGHLPPVVNPEASLKAPGAFCQGNHTVRFQDTDALTNQMTDHADIVTLGIFGHTHMDELHLLAGTRGAVPVKVVASVSPVDGNLPSFTIGVVDPASAILSDYSVYEASNKTGVGTQWPEEYDFDSIYHEQGFTPGSLHSLISRLHTDRQGIETESLAYKTHFRKDSNGTKLSPSWPGYVCSLDNPTADSFRTCVCTNQ